MAAGRWSRGVVGRLTVFGALAGCALAFALAGCALAFALAGCELAACALAFALAGCALSCEHATQVRATRIAFIVS
jgi:hypothetical protein